LELALLEMTSQFGPAQVEKVYPLDLFFLFQLQQHDTTHSTGFYLLDISHSIQLGLPTGAFLVNLRVFSDLPSASWFQENTLNPPPPPK
jgi:hypothetical protein